MCASSALEAPSGKSGLMLGEILGRMAGEMSVLLLEDIEPRFLAPRAPFASDLRLGNVMGEWEPVGPGVNWPEGVLRGPSFGVLRDVDSGLSGPEIRFGSMARGILAAASGRERGVRSGLRLDWRVKLGDWAVGARGELRACCCMRISEAGVAGPRRVGWWDWGAARRAGEWVAEAG